jgi:hypothetical protein
MPMASGLLATGGGGVFASLAMLLGLAGVAKIVRPAATAVTIGRLPGLRRMGIQGVARAVGALELLIAAAALAVGNRLAAVLLTACYLAFVVVTVVLLRIEGDADCGCFGASPSPLNHAHLAATVSFTAFAALAIVAPPGPFLGSPGFEVLGGVPFLVLVLTLTGCGYLLVTALPELADIRGRVRRLSETPRGHLPAD